MSSNSKSHTGITSQKNQDILTSMDKIASTLKNKGNHSAAREFDEQILEKRIEILGPEHQETLTSMGNLAVTLANIGELELAERHASTAWEKSRNSLGKQHPGTAISAWIYFNCLHQLERHQEAQPIIRSLEWLCEVEEDSLPTDLRELRRHLQPLFKTEKENGQSVSTEIQQKAAGAQKLMQQEEWVEAEEIWQQLYSEHLKNDGEEHPHTARTAFMLFQCLHRQEKTDLAQDMLQSLRWITENDEAQIPIELRELRQVLHQINESDSPNVEEKTPEEMLKKLSEVVEEHGDNAPPVLQAKSRTALHFVNRGELRHAADLFASLHKYHLQQDGKQHPHTALIAWNYFHCLRRQDKHDDASAIFETLSWVRELDNNELPEELLDLRKKIDDYIESKDAENLKG
ncbi:MAG: hypothetical protein ACI8PB_005036 [Desulforhopalus sp.]|jgi:hypothetical protein